MSQYGQQPFDMGNLAGALPQNVPSNMSQRAYGSPDLSQGLSSSNPYQQQQQAMFAQPRVRVSILQCWREHNNNSF